MQYKQIELNKTIIKLNNRLTNTRIQNTNTKVLEGKKSKPYLMNK